MEFPFRPFVGNWPSHIIAHPSSGTAPAGNSPTTVAWTTANTALFIPVRIQVPCVVRQMVFMIGTAAAGTVDTGIYTMDGIRLVSTGPGANVAGANVVDVADTAIGPGVYYLAMLCGTTPPSPNAQNLGAQRLEVLGLASAAIGSGTLPATVTLATTLFIGIPVVGAVTREGTY